MADEKVVIKIDFDAKTAGLRRANMELNKLQRRVEKLSSGREEAFARRTANNLGEVTKKWKRHTDFIDKGISMMGKAMSGFLMKSIQGVIVEMTALGATMVAVHATFVAGQLIMKAYRGLMQMLASGAAGLTVGLAAVSAAIREQQAAIFAYRGKGAPAFGSAMNQTRMAMRNLQSDTQLASLGMEALNKAYGNMSKSMNTAQINQSTSTIKALMDFGSAGQDPAKGLEQVSIVISALADKKKSLSDVMTEAKKLGPEMQKALKSAKVKTKKDFEDLLLSGDLAKKGGVSGQFAAVNNTLIAQLKGYFTRIRGEFSDFGDFFLEPLKVAFDKTFGVFRRDLQRAFGTIQYSFGTDRTIDGITGAIEKTTGWAVDMLRKYLPAAQGMLGRIGDWWDRFKRGWNLVLEQTRPLIDGARIIYKAWEPIWEAIKRGATNLTLFRDLLVSHEADMVEFGNRIAGLIDTLSKFFQGLKKMFADMAPFINDLLAGITGVFSMLTKTLTMFAGRGFASAFAPLIAFSVAARGMAGTKGRMMPGSMGSTIAPIGQMQVQAQSVIVNGKPVGGTNAALTTHGRSPSGISLSSGAGGVAAHSTRATGAGLAETATKFKSTGGSIARTPKDLALSSGQIYQPRGAVIPGFNYQRSARVRDYVKAIQNTQGAGFFSSLLGGSRTAGQRSNIHQRIRDRFVKNQQTGRGIGYYLFGKTGTPYPGSAPGSPGAVANQSAHADAVLRGYSMDQLHRTAVWHGVTGLTDKSTRTEIIGKLSVQPTYQSAVRSGAFDAETPAPTLGQAVRNSGKRALIRGVSAADRMQYATKRAFGGFRGAMAALNSPAFNPETGEYFDMAKMRDDANQGFANRQTAGMGNIRNKFIRMRQMNRINRNYGRFGNAYNNRFAKSTGGRMGAAMGLGMLSQVAPEEMRGSMALGASLAQIDPRLGLAVAGIGGAFTARGATKGALSGAMGGAAIGGMLGPMGAAVGAGIGLLVGGIMGAVNKGEQQLKEARAVVRESMGKFYLETVKAAGTKIADNRKIVEQGGSLAAMGASGLKLGETFARTQSMFGKDIRDAIEAGGGSYTRDGKTEFNDANAILDAFFKSGTGKTISQEGQSKMRKRATNSVREILNASDPAVQGQLKRIDEVNTKRIEALSRATGKSGAELEQLAKSLGVNLYDATMRYDELLNKLADGLIKTSEELNGALSDVFLSGANPFTEARKAAEAGIALNQNFRQVGDVLRGKGSKAEKQKTVNAGMEQAFSQILTIAGGDAIKAYSIFQEMFGQGKTGGIFGKNQELEGQASYYLDNPLFQQSANAIEKGFNTEAATQIRGRLAQKGFAIDQGAMETAIADMTPEQKKAFLGDVSKLGKGGSGPRKDISELEAVLLSGDQKAIQTYLKKTMKIDAAAVTKEDTKKLDEIATAATDFAKAAGGLEDAVKLFSDMTRDLFTAPLQEVGPKWWSDGLAWDDANKRLVPPSLVGGGDTSTPRAGAVGDTATSKLSQTMARHAAMDGQLTGKRTVTSSLRGYALGSINSDHITGSAYDLVGQNLGQYARLVHANGGFAEFHGSMANRHLHVVPGPGIGDTRTSRAGQSVMTSSQGQVNNYYTFEINGGNSSPEAIANEVMAKIEAKQRSIKERR